MSHIECSLPSKCLTSYIESSLPCVFDSLDSIDSIESSIPSSVLQSCMCLCFPSKTHGRLEVDRKKPPPPGGFPIYYVPSSKTVCKRTPLEEPGTNPSRGVLLHTVLDEGTYQIGNLPPRGGGFFRSKWMESTPCVFKEDCTSNEWTASNVFSK